MFILEVKTSLYILIKNGNPLENATSILSSNQTYVLVSKDYAKQSFDAHFLM